MSENNYGALMMKSAVGVSENINAILSPGIYIIPPANSSSPDIDGGVLIVHSGTPIRRTFSSDSTVAISSTYNTTNSQWGAWNKSLARQHPFADIKLDGVAAVAEALANIGLGTTDNYTNLGNGYRLTWIKGNVPGGALAAASAIAVPLTFTQSFGANPFLYWAAVSTPSGVVAGAGVIATCADLTTTGMSLNLYNASNATKQITAVIGFAIGKV